ncbi:MAG: gliding motility protein [Emticicia sp.]|uniref:gliding motility lipoprotein GldB n=1 Tax=Emticicia sp. TaxID=1930953 RepID=UPI003BA4B1C5
MKLRFVCSIAISLTIGLLLLVACQNSETVDTANISVKVDIQRFDQTMMQLKTKEQIKDFLSKNTKFVNQFYQTSPDDTALINRLFLIHNNPDTQAFYEDTKESFGNLNDLKQELITAFKHIKFYYPDFKEPQIITTFTALDLELVVSDDMIVIPLETFLGPKARYRPQYPIYLLKRFDKPYIVPSILTILSKKYNAIDANDRTLLGDMVYYGKSYEFTRAMLPDVADSLVIAYADSNMTKTWNSQDLVWGYFLDNKLLYETNDRIKDKYLGDRPKVQEIGNDCPGRIGQWLGWRIVSRYRTENPSISLIDLMKNSNARDIFEKSKYKGQLED